MVWAFSLWSDSLVTSYHNTTNESACTEDPGACTHVCPLTCFPREPFNYLLTSRVSDWGPPHPESPVGPSAPAVSTAGSPGLSAEPFQPFPSANRVWEGFASPPFLTIISGLVTSHEPNQQPAQKHYLMWLLRSVGAHVPCRGRKHLWMVLYLLASPFCNTLVSIQEDTCRIWFGLLFLP